jgi:Protein of unknown function (DUF2934)
MSDLEELIRVMAYELWDQAGRPHGRSEEFWFAARAEFEGEAETGEGQDVGALVPPPDISPALAAPNGGKTRTGAKPKAKRS